MLSIDIGKAESVEITENNYSYYNVEYYLFERVNKKSLMSDVLNSCLRSRFFGGNNICFIYSPNRDLSLSTLSILEDRIQKEEVISLKSISFERDSDFTALEKVFCDLDSCSVLVDLYKFSLMEGHFLRPLLLESSGYLIEDVVSILKKRSCFLYVVLHSPLDELLLNSSSFVDYVDYVNVDVKGLVFDCLEFKYSDNNKWMDDRSYILNRINMGYWGESDQEIFFNLERNLSEDKPFDVLVDELKSKEGEVESCIECFFSDGYSISDRKLIILANFFPMLALDEISLLVNKYVEIDGEIIEESIEKDYGAIRRCGLISCRSESGIVIQVEDSYKIKQFKRELENYYPYELLSLYKLSLGCIFDGSLSRGVFERFFNFIISFVNLLGGERVNELSNLIYDRVSSECHDIGSEDFNRAIYMIRVLILNSELNSVSGILLDRILENECLFYKVFNRVNSVDGYDEIFWLGKCVDLYWVKGNRDLERVVIFYIKRNDSEWNMPVMEELISWVDSKNRKRKSFIHRISGILINKASGRDGKYYKNIFFRRCRSGEIKIRDWIYDVLVYFNRYNVRNWVHRSIDLAYSRLIGFKLRCIEDLEGAYANVASPLWVDVDHRGEFVLYDFKRRYGDDGRLCFLYLIMILVVGFRYDEKCCLNIIGSIFDVLNYEDREKFRCIIVMFCDSSFYSKDKYLSDLSIKSL